MGALSAAVLGLCARRANIIPLTLSHPFRNQVTATDTEKSAIRFRGHSFRKV